MTSDVFFHDARASSKKNRLQKVKELYQRSGFASRIEPGDRVAVKIHWGEPGNVGFIPPPYVRIVVDLIRESGGSPFVTDTNTLYTGMRRDAVSNLTAAAMNGFTPLTIGAPILVADGLTGRDSREVELEGTSILGKAKIASGIFDADAMIVLSHVKGHMLFGFGGALKNLGMGCATPAGKQVLHSDVRPRVDEERCHGDGICIRSCPADCIEWVDRAEKSKGSQGKKVVKINTERCIGCGECTATCPHQAIPIQWKTSEDAIQKKTAEYALAAVKNKREKVGFINFIIQVTPDCDCCNWNDSPFVPDIGFAASVDPVAVDAASVALVEKATPIPGSRADKCKGDPWRAVYDIDHRIILAYAEEIGLGRKEHRLIKL
jgi:uncharacterized protein